jgi:hypothetical protein
MIVSQQNEREVVHVVLPNCQDFCLSPKRAHNRDDHAIGC